MKRLALVVLALGLVLGGCGGDDGTTTTEDKDTTGQQDTGVEDINVEDDTAGEPDQTGKEDVIDPEDDKVVPDEVSGPDCFEICGEAECGTIDECNCGECTGNYVCETNMCVCKPNCDGKECGADGCGGECGTCTGGEVCAMDGTCGEACDPATLTFDPLVGKVTWLSIGNGGFAGEALDIDGDPSTCAPDGNCEDGLNNQLSGLLDSLSSFVNVQEELDKAVAGGDVLLLAEMVGAKNDGSTFQLNFYLGKAKEPVETCDYQAAKCEYYIDVASLDPVSCQPIIKFDNAAITGGKLKAGGPDDLFSVSIPIQEGVTITVTANMAQIVGDVTLDPVAVTNGLIGGAVRKDKIMEAVDMLPPDVVAELPVSIDIIKSMLDMFIEPDVDTDADDDPDAASIGIKFTAIDGTILGIEPAGE